MNPNQPMNRYDYDPAPEGYDPRRWRMAQARASFKIHALTYAGVITLLWIIWALTTPNSYVWPIWPTLGWGIGLASHGFGAYSSGNENLVEREYRKLSEK